MSLIEITHVDAFPPAARAVRAFAIDAPTTGERSESDGFVLAGWVLGQTEPVQTVTVSESGRTLTDLAVDGRRPDVAAAHAAATAAETSGFQGWVPTVGLGPTFTLEVHAIAASGQHAALGTIAGRRQRPEAAAPSNDAPGHATARLPHFVIIGAQRGGTRSLYRYLAAHPDILPAATEEVHYFSLFFDRGLRWYQAQFPPLEPGRLTGEASPYYLYHPLAAERMRAVVPEANLIVLLRDPVDRAYSHYQLEARQGNEPLSFEAAIAAEPERLAGEAARVADDDTYVSFAHQHYSYLARGHYVEQLRRWLKLFPRDQLLVLKSEDLFQHPAALYRRVTDFLGLEPRDLVARPGVAQSPSEPMASETQHRLQAYFAAENEGLSELVGAEMTWPEPAPERAASGGSPPR